MSKKWQQFLQGFWKRKGDVGSDLRQLQFSGVWEEFQWQGMNELWPRWGRIGMEGTIYPGMLGGDLADKHRVLGFTEEIVDVKGTGKMKSYQKKKNFWYFERKSGERKCGKEGLRLLVNMNIFIRQQRRRFVGVRWVQVGRKGIWVLERLI